MKSVTGHVRWHVTGMYATFSFRSASGSRSFRTLDQLTFSAKWAAVSAAVQSATPRTIRRACRDIATPPDGAEAR